MSADIDEKRRVYNLSRRRVLGGLGAVGLASAGAGLGTTAFFSDSETFENNVLAAGSLDLTVDWEEHYYWDQEGLGQLDIHYMEPDPADEYVGFPDPTNPMVWVHESDVEAFMDGTTLESYPTVVDGAVQDNLENYVACDDFAQLDANLDPTNGRGKGSRSANEDTILNYDEWVDEQSETDPEIAPLVNLHDVKPGDFGELTLSMHLCDNPGYIWLQGELVEARENGHTEPEMNDVNESGGPNTVNDTGNDVEILDAIQTMLWYDEDGDNIYEPGGDGSPVCVQLVLDASGSMSGDRNQDAIDAASLLADEIISVNPDNKVGVTFFSADGYDSSAQLQQSVADAGATDVAITQDVIDDLPADGGSTAIGEGILTADEDLANCDPDDQRIMIVITDGQNNAGTSPSVAADDVTGTDSDDYTDEIFAVGTGGATDTVLSGFARPNDDVHKAFADDSAELNDILSQIAQILIGEEKFFSGSLRELLEAVSTDFGIPLDGIRATQYDEVTGDNLPSPGQHEAREEFVNSTTNAIGLAWWLPVDHANEIQSDSVMFDLGFYTEQSRHNTGAGISQA